MKARFTVFLEVLIKRTPGQYSTETLAAVFIAAVYDISTTEPTQMFNNRRM